MEKWNTHCTDVTTEQLRMSKLNQRFGNNFRFHLQDEYFMAGLFSAKVRDVIFFLAIQHHEIKFTTYCLLNTSDSQNAKPLHIHSEDGNCNVHRNIG